MPNVKKEAYCGLVCSVCPIYLASQEDGALLETTAQKLKQSIEETLCNGCKSNKVSIHCLQCKLRKCATEKNVECCSECEEYPCLILRGFQKEMFHSGKPRKSLKNINEEDFEAWYQEMLQSYSSKKHGIAPDKELIKEHLSKIKNYFGLSN